MLNFQTQPIAETKHSELFFFTWFHFYKDVNDQHPKWIQKPGSVSLNHLLLLCVFCPNTPHENTDIHCYRRKSVTMLCELLLLEYCNQSRGFSEDVRGRGAGKPTCLKRHCLQEKKSSMLLLMGKRYFFSFNFTLHKYFSCAFSFAEYPPRSEYVPLSAPTQKTKLCTSQARTLTLPTYNFQSKPTLCEESCITKELK